MSTTIEYSKFITLKDEPAPNQGTLKSRVMFFYPDLDGKPRGMVEQITYDNNGVAILWEYPHFKDKHLVEQGQDLVLVDIN